MINKLKKKKGFTLIELIVVIAILAVLVLLASPRFFGRTQEAVFTKHISNSKVIQNASELYFMDEDDWPRLSDEPYTSEEIEAFAEKIYGITGEEVNLDTNGNYYNIDYNALNNYVSVNDEDRANYILQNPVGKVYYLEGLSESGENRVDFESPGEDVEETDEIPEYYVQATDLDFEKDNNGRWRYVGSDTHVIIPHVIDGEAVTSYRNMFRDTAVEGVVSDNPNVTDMRFMFWDSSATTLDLSNFDTSSVTNMGAMFAYSSATTLDLSNFDTSSVTNMGAMFAYSSATTFDLSSFDTSKVTNMGSMFDGSNATTLDLSSFDTSSVTNMSEMFRNSSATTLDLSSFDTSNVTNMARMFQASSATNGLARTQTDANHFNKSTHKPGGLNFIVKPQ